MTKKALLGFRVLLLAIIISSCGNMNFDLPYGPKGPRGRTAYDVWKEQVNKGQIDWPKDQVEVSDYIIYIKGPKGDKGDDGLSAYETWKAFIKDNDVPNPHVPGEMWKKDRNSQSDFWDFLTGRDGNTPYVGENKNWWIGTTDTGVYAYGTIGTDGLSAYDRWLVDVEAGTAIDNSGNVWPKTKKSLDDFFTYWKGKDGRLGLTPKIGSDGNWWIGETNTNVPAKGQDGKSAYELWAKDVKEEKVQDNHGKPWPKDKFSKEEYWKYLHGDKGPKGDSAYELWKVEVEKGNVDVPGKPGEKWPAGDNSISHFWKYLTGPEGKNGTSAYELWKKDLNDKFGTADQLVNHKTGLPWSRDKNSIIDFWEYTRGRDGDDGADGKPGEPGAPGNLVKIIKGMPNVVAQYSQVEYSEYVSVFDGSVTYKVYDENGKLAPGAKIFGMPGVEDKPGQPFVANEKGEFTIPRDRLPWKADLKDHWGFVREVEINGVKKKSATNTYVPNQIRMKLEFVSEGKYIPQIVSDHQLYFRIMRQRDPGLEWEDLPSYLPEVTGITFGAFKVSNHLDPTNTMEPQTKENVLDEVEEYKRVDRVFKVCARRFTKQTVTKDPALINRVRKFWEGNQDYCGVAQMTSYYGLKVKWDGSVKMVPYQQGPKLVSLKLRKYDKSTNQFLRVEGELDYSVVDFTMIPRQTLKHREDTAVDGVTKLVLVEPDYFTEQDAKKQNLNYISATFYLPNGGIQQSYSNGKYSGGSNSTFVMNTVKLGSEIASRTAHWTYSHEYKIGHIEVDGTLGDDPSKYKFKVKLREHILYTAPTVTYEHN